MFYMLGFPEHVVAPASRVTRAWGPSGPGRRGRLPSAGPGAVEPPMPNHHHGPVAVLHAAHAHALADRPPLAIGQARADSCRPTTPDVVVPRAIPWCAVELTAHRLSQRRSSIKGQDPPRAWAQTAATGRHWSRTASSFSWLARSPLECTAPFLLHHQSSCHRSLPRSHGSLTGITIVVAVDHQHRRAPLAGATQHQLRPSSYRSELLDPASRPPRLALPPASQESGDPCRRPSLRTTLQGLSFSQGLGRKQRVWLWIEIVTEGLDVNRIFPPLGVLVASCKIHLNS
jgi:hypothetical protein